MKIAFIGGRTFHHPDGIATFMYNLASELVQMGHEPIVYQESDHNGEEWINGFKVVHQKSTKSAIYNKMGLGVKSTFNAVFNQNDVQLIHYNCGGPALFSSIIARLFRRKVILQLHGLEFMRTKYSPFWRWISKTLFDFYCRIFRNITVCSNEQHEYIKHRFKKESTIITGAVNISKVDSHSDILERFNIKPNNYILYMGRLVQDKNPDCLIKGFIESNYGDKQLVICGSAAPGSSYGDKLYQLASSCDNVIFTGSIFGDEKDVIFKNCWAYCLPSTIEGLPISLLEAMSYGKICIASDIPANKEALGDSGVWVRKENEHDITLKLNELYENYEQFKWQQTANLERVMKNFTWKSKAEEYVSFISKIVSCK